MKKSNNKMLTMMRRLPSDCVYGKILSPVGELTLVASEKGLHAILWENEGYDKEMVEILNQLSQKPQQKHIQSAKKQLGEYFKGKRKDFDIPLVMDGTEFQKKLGGNCLKFLMAKPSLTNNKPWPWVIKIKCVP